MQQENKLTIKQHLELLENAIDLGTARGAYNKMQVVNIVNSLTELHRYILKHESGAVNFKGVPQQNENKMDT